MIHQQTLLNKGKFDEKTLNDIDILMTEKGYKTAIRRCGELSGIRCTKVIDGISVVEECVADKTEMCVRMYIDRKGGKCKSELLPLLIKQGCAGEDDGLEVTNKPTYIERGNLMLAADVMAGKKRYKLPVIFMSRTTHDELGADARVLLKELYGHAHIFIEKMVIFSPSLKTMSGDNNPHHGAVGVYYPDGRRWCLTIDKAKLEYMKDDYLSEQAGKLIHYIKKYGRERKVPERLTWQGLTAAILSEEREIRRKAEADKENTANELEALKNGLESAKEAYHKQAMDDADRILDEFERDYQDTKTLNERLQKEVERLTAENEGYRSSREKKAGSPVIYQGSETDHYPGEIREIVLAVLNENKDTLESGTRRRDVIDDILNANGKGREADRRSDEIVSLLNSYDGMTPRFAADLKALGIEITDEGKHYKLTLDGDGRYQMTLSRTPSDKKSGKNGGRIMAKRFF